MQHGFSKGGISILALSRLLRVSPDGDYAVGTWNFHHILNVTWTSHKSPVSRTSEYSMVHALERDHFEGKCLRPIILWSSKGNIQSDLSQGISLSSWDNSVKNHRAMVQLGLRDLHPAYRFDIENIDAATTVHEGLGETITINKWIDD